MTASAAPSVTPRLSSALLRQLPTRFFGGLPATIQELLQNALRAGATAVDFTLDGLVLCVRDNGRGLHDPQLLMTAGESGWGEEVINPAGLGALSVLNPDFAAHVRYASGHWAVELTPEDFAAGRPLPVQNAPFTPGFEVSVTLKEARNLKGIIAQRRGYVPITVRFQGEEIPAKVPRGQAIQTPVGTLWYTRDPRMEQPSGIWESFPTEARQVYERMAKLDPVAQAFVSKFTLSWQIDPACGVRPKLPDRTQLIENQALDEAAQTLSRAILALVSQEFSTRLDLSALQLDRQATQSAQWVFTPEVLRAFLTARGFTPSVLSAPSQAGATLCYDPDDNSVWGWEYTWIQTDQPVLYAAQDNEQAALNYLRELGAQPALGCAAARTPVPEVAATNAQVFFDLRDDWNGSVAVAALSPDLTPQGQPVPFLMTGRGVENHADSALVLRGTPEEAERFLRTHQEALGGLLVMEVASNNPNPDNIGLEEGDVTAADLGKMLLERFIGHFFPQRAQAQQAVQQLREQRANLFTAAQAMTRVVGSFPEGSYAACLAQLQAQIQAHDVQIASLSAAHQLD